MASTDVITELFALVGFKIDDKPLLKFTAKIYGTVALLTRIADEATRAIVSLDNLNKTLGIGADVLREWGFIAEQSNVKADSVIQAFQTIAKTRGDMLSGRGLNNAWALLGIDPSQDPEQVFNEVLNKLGQIEDVNLRNTRITDLGFDPQLVNLIGKTRKYLGSIFKDLQVTEKEKNSLLELKKSFVDLRITFSLLKEKLMSAFFPIQLAIDLTTRLSQIFYKITDNTIGWADAIKIVIAILVGYFMHLNPIKSLLIGIGLAIEDIWTYLQGGESVIGIIIDEFNNLGIVVKTVLSTIAAALSMIAIVKFIGQLQKMLSLMIALYATNPFTFWLAAIAAVAYAIKKLYDWWKNRKKNKETNDFDPEIENIRNLEKNIAPNVGNNQGIANINNNPNITNNFNIDGSKNPQAVANEIFSYQEQLNETSLMYQ